MFGDIKMTIEDITIKRGVKSIQDENKIFRKGN